MADVFITPSTSETQGLTCLEAMASGIPVVCKNDPSFNVLIQHNQNGFLFNDPSELQDIIYFLKQDKISKNKIINNAYITVEKLSCKAFAKSVLDVYLKIIDK